MKYVSVVALAGIALLAIGCGKSEPDLDDSKVVDKLLEDALEGSKMQERGPVGEQLAYAPKGHSATFYPNGAVKEVGVYLNEKRDGKWFFYHEDGSLSSIEYYKKGSFQRGAGEVYYTLAERTERKASQYRYEQERGKQMAESLADLEALIEELRAAK